MKAGESSLPSEPHKEIYGAFFILCMGGIILYFNKDTNR